MSKAKLYVIYQYILGFSEINLVLNWKTIKAYDRLISRVIIAFFKVILIKPIIFSFSCL